jgi:hypothetical protein
MVDVIAEAVWLWYGRVTYEQPEHIFRTQSSLGRKMTCAELPDGSEAVPVSLQELVDALDFRPAEFSSYLDRVTGAIYTVSDEAFRIAEGDGTSWGPVPEWQEEEVELARCIAASDRYLALPGSWDIHEWNIMSQFCYSIADDDIRAECLTAISGRGAFRRFKDRLAQYGLQDGWDKFRRQALRALAIEWCEANAVPFVE